MKRALTYVMGEPGSGKTTVSRLLLDGLRAEVKSVPYVTWTEYHPRFAQIGHDRETFGGTDSLSMAAQKKVIAWLEEQSKHQFIYAEGDRLTNAKFFDWALEHFDNVDIVALWNPKVAAKRRAARNAEIGKEQNEVWLQGRRTKIERLMKEYKDHILVLDAGAPASHVVQAIRRKTNVGVPLRRLAA